MMKELKMPGVYVEMQEDEMMYLDGGGISNKHVAVAIDAALVFAGIGAGATVATVIRKFGSATLKRAVKSGLLKIGINTVMAIKVSDTVLTLLSWSVGGAAAWILDGLDGQRNGYFF